MITPVILSGGSGTRLWPLSNKKEPKQFLSLVNEKSLLQETLLRVMRCENISAPMIVNSLKHQDLLAEQLSKIACTPFAIILEPVARNTAPAIAIAAFVALATQSDPMLMVLPSDHVIRDHKAFCHAVKVAEEFTKQDFLVTFGIVPNRPETGYGYIKQGKKLHEQAFSVSSFVEKPDLKRAQEYLESGEYYWNSGMFVFRASVFLSELKRYEPEIYEVCKKVFESCKRDGECYYLDEKLFSDCKKISVDYAVMERTPRAVVVPVDAGWSDIGSWAALLDCCKRDKNGNVLIGDVAASNVKNAYLRVDSKKLITIGVEDIVVVESGDAILVAHKNASEELKKIIEGL